jgi:hypothetical protein
MPLMRLAGLDITDDVVLDLATRLRRADFAYQVHHSSAKSRDMECLSDMQEPFSARLLPVHLAENAARSGLPFRQTRILCLKKSTV